MPHDAVDQTIKALADPTRRAMLDALREGDGQSLSSLGTAAPSLGKHAVLKHFRILEQAGLVTSRKEGRQRLVFLNPVPVLLLAQRWLDDYGARSARQLTRLKTHLETETLMPSTTSTPTTRTVRAAIIIKATPERVWHALTDPEECRQWYFGTYIRSTFELGTALDYVDDVGVVQIRGTVVEVEVGRLLVHTFNATWSDDVRNDQESLYTWRLELWGADLTQVTIEHSRIPVGSHTDGQVEQGATTLLSSLKTLLETGRPLPVSGS
ncbi:MAG: SRPBCC domain-containing protein [Lapillicoccus sp.]